MSQHKKAKMPAFKSFAPLLTGIACTTLVAAVTVYSASAQQAGYYANLISSLNSQLGNPNQRNVSCWRR